MLKISKHAFVWLVVLATGALCLRGRFLWDEESLRFSQRSWWLCLYYFSLTVPLTYYLPRALGVSKRSSALLTTVVWVVFSLPYRWLGLEKFFFPLEGEFYRNSTEYPVKNLDWFPEGLSNLPAYPGEFWLLGGTLAVGSLLIYVIFQKRPLHLRFSLAFFALLLFQTWLHTSVRSPYTYIPHFEQAPEADYWYQYYLFPEVQQGAVNRDYHVFSNVEQIFQGVKEAKYALMERAFPHYVLSQFTRFFHPYYAWMVANIFLWSLLVWAVYCLAKNWWGERVGAWAAFCAVMAHGPIAFVAQPFPYVMAMALIPLLLLVYDRLFDSQYFRRGYAVLFGVCLGCAMLIYSFETWLLTLPVLCFVQKRSWRGMLVSILIGVLVYQGSQWISRHVGEIKIVLGLDPVMNPFSHIKHFLLNGQWFRLVWRGLVSPLGYLGTLAHAFQFILPLSLFALWQLRKSPRWKETFVLHLPGYFTYTLMYVAGVSHYTDKPRLVYVIFPVVFMLAGKWLQQSFERRPRVTLAIAACLLLIVNLDVFGFPSIYYVWLYKRIGYSLQ